MAKKHLSEDEIRYVISAETDKAQKEIYALSKATKDLKQQQRERLKSMIELESKGKKESDTYKKLAAEYKAYGKQISDNNKRMGELTRKLDVNVLSMAQLKKQSRDLHRELDNVSKALDPERYALLEGQIKKVDERMNELKVSAKSLREIATSETALGAMSGIVLTKFAEKAGEYIARMKDIVAEGIEMAESADGVKKAFDALDDGTILNNLRKATKGTVTDLDLMKATVQANDFRIPLDDLGKYLQFAQLKAQQTGQSVDYMTSSIVTGLGRKSVMILDNLGLSAAEINEQMAQTGDFMLAVASIVDKQLAEAGDNYVSSADRAQAATVRFQNAQRELGETLLPLKEKWDNFYTGASVTTMELLGWIVKHRKALTLLVTAYTTYIATQKAVTVWNAKYAKSTLFSVAAEKRQALQLALTRKAFLAKLIVLDLYKGRCNLATAATEMFNLVLKASPIGVVTTLLATASIAFFAFRTKVSEVNSITIEANKSIFEEKKQLDTLKKVLFDSSKGYGERKSALDEIQKIVPEYHATLTEEGKLINNNTEALSGYVEKLQVTAKQQAALSKLSEANTNRTNWFAAQDKSTALKFKSVEWEISDPMNSGKSIEEIAASQGVSPTAYKAWAAKKKQLDDQISLYEAMMKTYTEELLKIDAKYSSADSASEKTDLIEAKKKEIEESEKVVASTKEEVIARNQKVAALKAELEILQNLGLQKKTKTNQKNDDSGDKERVAAEKKIIEDMQALRNQELDTEERSYTASLNAYRLMLHNKQMSQVQFDIWQAAFNRSSADKRLLIEKNFARKSEELDLEHGELKEKAVKDANSRVEKAEQTSFNARLKAEQTYINNLEEMRQMVVQTPTSAVDRLEAEHNTRLLLLESYYKASLEYAKENGQDEKEVTDIYNQAKLSLHQKYQQDKLELVKNTENAIRALQGNSISQEFTTIYNSIENLQGALEHIGEENFWKNFGENILQNMQQIVGTVTNGLSKAFNTFKQIEIDNVEAKYDAEIEAAQGNEEKIEQLEQEKAQKKLDIEKKYADVQFAIKASQIIANTALAVMMALGQLGPIAGPIAAAVMSATGVVELAATNAERDKVKNMTLSGSSSSGSAAGARVATGRQEGGKIDVRRAQDGKLFPNSDYDPDARGFIDHPTVIVGEGPSGQSKEWVASNAAVENPTVAPILDILDKSQQAGNIRTLDLNQAIRARMAGYASGGSISSTSSTPDPVPTGNSGAALPPELMEKLARSIIHLDEYGVPASVVLSDIERKTDLRNRARAIGSKKQAS